MFMPDGVAHGIRAWNIIPQVATGPDWFAGDTFFIRSRSQPTVYWVAHNTKIHTSDVRRTKFQIQLDTAKPPPSQTVVLVRDDRVTVTAVLETASHATQHSEVRYLSTESDSNLLALTKRGYSNWTFGDLINGRIGVKWIEDVGTNGKERPRVSLMTNGGGEEWELC